MYNQRLIKLANKLNNGEGFFLYSGELMNRSLDQSYPFEVQKDFYYTTGIDEEKAGVLVYKQNDEINTILYKPMTDPLTAKWNGAYLSIEEAKEISKIELIRDQVMMLSEIPETIKSNNITSLYMINSKYVSFKFVEELTKLLKNDKVKILELNPLIYPMRLIKDENEIKDLKKAIEITNKGLYKVLDNLKQINSEACAQSIFESVLIAHNAPLAFPTIAANHYNATTLHYVKNNARFKPNSLILLDLGASYNHYCADISRTYPINGKYTKRQKELYNIVYKVNTEIIKFLKPGLNWKDVQEKALSIMADELMRIKLITNRMDVKNYFFHNVGHPLGLDTHDVRLEQLVLEENMVVTVEPGLYIPEEAIGIRIEDDILITAKGAKSLSKNILKSADEIEAYLQK